MACVREFSPDRDHSLEEAFRVSYVRSRVGGRSLPGSGCARVHQWQVSAGLGASRFPDGPVRLSDGGRLQTMNIRANRPQGHALFGPGWNAVGLLLLLAVLLACGCGGGGGSSAWPGPGGAMGGLTVQAAPDDGPPGPPDPHGWADAQPRALAPPATATPPASASPVADHETWGTLFLDPGWNMASFPVAGLTSLQTGPGVLPSAYAWDPVSRGYLEVDLRDPSSLAAGEGTGRGFWVFSLQRSYVQYGGWPNGGTHADSDVSLAEGWNLLGYPYGQTCAFSKVQVLAPGGASTLQPLTQSVSLTPPSPGQDTPLYRDGYFFQNAGYRSLNLAVPTGAFQVGRAMGDSTGRPALTPAAGS